MNSKAVLRIEDASPKQFLEVLHTQTAWLMPEALKFGMVEPIHPIFEIPFMFGNNHIMATAILLELNVLSMETLIERFNDMNLDFEAIFKVKREEVIKQFVQVLEENMNTARVLLDALREERNERQDFS